MPIISPSDSLLLVIDIQERLLKAVSEPESVRHNAEILTKSAALLQIPAIFTEQYPQGLGATLDTLRHDDKALFFAKKSFSAMRETDIAAAVAAAGKKQVVICGIETHICVSQTARELLQKGFEVYVAANASGSRQESEHRMALRLLERKGAYVTSVEGIVFDWLQSSTHPQFKAVQGLIK